MIRDRKGRFSLPPKSPAYLAEQALLSRVREVLKSFSFDISEGTVKEFAGIAVTVRTPRAGLAEEIERALAPLVPAGRVLCVGAYLGHAHRFSYGVSIYAPGYESTAATPRAAHVGGPLASAEVSA